MGALGPEALAPAQELECGYTGQQLQHLTHIHANTYQAQSFFYAQGTL